MVDNLLAEWTNLTTTSKANSDLSGRLPDPANFEFEGRGGF